MIYLYVKTHNKTGLKYLGKTKSKDPFKYKGSGKRWVNHIRKHGYDVTTEILLATENEEELKETGIFFSNIFNVVESKNWANLKIEQADGGWDYINDNGFNGGSKIAHLYKTDENFSKHLSKKISSGLKRYIKENGANWSGKHHTEETKMKMRKSKNKGSANSQYGTIWITNGDINKKIKKEELIPEGWYKGRKI